MKHVCRECGHTLDEADDYCPKHPKAIVDSVLEPAAQAEPDLDLTPLSVGFDLRAQKMLVALPASARWVRYDLDGDTREAIGTTAELVQALEAAGYAIEVTQ